MGTNEDLARKLGLDLGDPKRRLGIELAQADVKLVEELVELRMRKNLTQVEVAKRMKRDKSAVSNFERLGADPHLSTIRRYARAIGARIAHLVEDTEAPRGQRPKVDWVASQELFVSAVCDAYDDAIVNTAPRQRAQTRRQTTAERHEMVPVHWDRVDA